MSATITMKPARENNDATSEQFKDFTSLLYDQALLVEGSPVQNPTAFAQKITKLMEANLS